MSLNIAKTLVNNTFNFLQNFQSKLSQIANQNGSLSVPKMDLNQSVHYELAWCTAIITAAMDALEYPKRIHGESHQNTMEEKLALFFIADTLQDVQNRLRPHLSYTGFSRKEFENAIDINSVDDFTNQYYNEIFAAKIVEHLKDGHFGAYGLNEDQQMMFESFRAFAQDKVMPIAEKIHRHDKDIPDNIIHELAQMGCFGLSIPDTYGGFQAADNFDNTSMAVVTEELSRGSLGVAGSLITRPEIVSKALLKGGTEDQKNKWLPLLAAGEKFSAVAVTEPDFGSDVAAMKVQARKVEGGWRIDGTKTWCTFAARANVLLVLARSNSDLSLNHKGLSLFLAEKPQGSGHEFEHKQPEGGKISGRAIATIGYRGMHSFEVSFEDYFVPDENLIGEEKGLGQGFYLQMEGFAGGRLQTAARATGVMQAALESALSYAQERKVFGQPIINYGLTKFKLAKMAAIIQIVRQFTFFTARLMDQHKGMMEASLVKFYASRIAEWVTREAMQIHGGMGYAEEYNVSRYFVDARVFSIFEGAEDVLALRVIARSLLAEKLSN